MKSEMSHASDANSPERTVLGARRRIRLLIITNLIFAGIAALSVTAAYQVWQENLSLQSAIRDAESRADAERETAENAVKFMRELFSPQYETAPKATAESAGEMLDATEKGPQQPPET